MFDDSGVCCMSRDRLLVLSRHADWLISRRGAVRDRSGSGKSLFKSSQLWLEVLNLIFRLPVEKSQAPLGTPSLRVAHRRTFTRFSQLICHWKTRYPFARADWLAARLRQVIDASSTCSQLCAKQSFAAGVEIARILRAVRCRSWMI